MAKKIKTPSTWNITDAIESAKSEVETLKDELQSWYDNLPESFQNGMKGEALQEAIDGLDSSNVESLDLPESFANLDSGLPAQFNVPWMRQKSRAERASFAASLLRGAADKVREVVEQQEELQQTIDDATEERKKEGQTEPDVSDLEKPALDDSQREEANSFADEVEQAADEIENVQFPGMYS